ncbi:hypothetical protein [Enterovirga sp.]|uniref:hypothetical protein n=1 Tax=Enterovirga sp. TaxID=2026350 RepID=UPI002C059B52|nr:hypothetical protein [Enterovirga sp.]HMO28656.1 hypothetical protein [Enterovirga sp.]
MPGRKKPAKGETKTDVKANAEEAAPKSAAKAKRGKVAAKAETGKAEAPKAKVKAGKTTPNSRKPAPPAARTPVSRVTSAPATAKQALKSARAQAKALVAEIPVPAGPPQVRDSVRAIGNQIASWLHSELGRAMLAELLVYLAQQISTSVQKTAEEIEEPPPAEAGPETGEDPATPNEAAAPSRKAGKGAGKAPPAT